DRATHVDVDDCGAAVLVELGRLGHLRWAASGELQRHRFLDRVPSRFLKALARLADHRRAGDHLCHIETRPVTAHQRTERHVGYTRHRGEHDWAVDLHRTDFNRFERWGGGERGHLY